ncbi:hypothetical protein [Xenorhabdus bovienii]|uniref:hypothetical protein n=1 Tax=Xenorhabdus bovienii TaxID=40576 RepID=UPI0021584ABA|nr:hypothetical protein [Xenorhabdus bovienii]
MTVTYVDIRERKKKVEKAQNERINLIYSEAVALVNAYKNSLEIESDAWLDFDGIPQPYVMTGLIYGENFRKAGLTSIELSSDYAINFTIATVVDDSNRGGDTVLVNISLFVDDNVVTVIVGNEEQEYPIIDGNLVNICNAIKDQVLFGIDDPNLISRNRNGFDIT